MSYRVKKFVNIPSTIWDVWISPEEALEVFLNDSRNRVGEIVQIFSKQDDIVLVYKEGVEKHVHDNKNN